MKHPEVFIIPVMMLGDYFLTVWGAVLTEKGYQKHFKFQSYELNPLWQKSIAQRKWFNVKHLMIVALMSGFCAFWSIGWTETDDTLAEGLFGYLTVLYGSIIAVHLANILTFSYVARHLDCVSGEITMSHPLALCISQFRLLGFLFVLSLIAIFCPTPFVIGGLLSQVVMVLVKWNWLAQAKGAEKRTQ